MRMDVESACALIQELCQYIIAVDKGGADIVLNVPLPRLLRVATEPAIVPTAETAPPQSVGELGTTETAYLPTVVQATFFVALGVLTAYLIVVGGVALYHRWWPATETKKIAEAVPSTPPDGYLTPITGRCNGGGHGTTADRKG